MEVKMADRVSELAALSLTEKERDVFQRDVEQMLSFVDRMKELDVDGVEPLYQVTGGTLELREDVAEDAVWNDDGKAEDEAGNDDGKAEGTVCGKAAGAEAREIYLQGAPKRRDEYFAVPKSFS